MAKRILLVDDEPLILKGLTYTLEQEGYETNIAMDGEEALSKFMAHPYDLVLLDVMLPKMDGLTLCQRIREVSNVPIIMLTAKEFDLLQLFITNRGRPFSRQEMLDAVWKYDYSGDARTVDVHIRRLREKIERDNNKPEFILTKWKVGYYFTDKD